MTPEYRDATHLPVGQELRSVLVHIHSRGSRALRNPSMPLGYDRPACVIEVRHYNHPFSVRAHNGHFHAFLQGHKLSAMFTPWGTVEVSPGVDVWLIKVTTDLAGEWAYDPDTHAIWPWGRNGSRGSKTHVEKVRLLDFETEIAG